MSNPEEVEQEKPENPGNPEAMDSPGQKPKLQAITRTVGGGSSKLKGAVEFLGEHPFVTGVLALLGIGGLVLSIISYGVDRDESKLTGEQLAQVENALASVTSELQNQRDYIRGAADAYLELKSQYDAIKATDEEIWQQALGKVAAAEGVPLAQIEAAITLFVASVGQNENASQFDKALAQFAMGEFAAAGDLALLAAEEAAQKRIAAEKLLEQMEATRKAAMAEEREAFTLAGQARFAQDLYLEAVDAFEKALAVNPSLRAEEPKEWAFLQLQFSDAASLCGTIVEGVAAQEWLQRSIRGYRQTLEVFSRETSPTAWVNIQHGLALVLRVQAERAMGDARIRLLEESMVAYRNVLDTYTREASPQDWALTLTNMSALLVDQAAQADGDAKADLLQQAVEANRQALEVRSREQNPRAWADCLNNLATTLHEQSRIAPTEERAGLLEEAVSCFRLTLEVRTRDGLPADWARTQRNLGVVLGDQGKIEGEGEELERLMGESIAASRASMEVFTRESFPQDWASAKRTLATGLTTLAFARSGEERASLLAEAVQAYRDSLEVHTKELWPHDWASIQNNIGSSLMVQSYETVGPEKLRLLEESAIAYRLSLEVYSPDFLPGKWRSGLRNLALTLNTQAKQTEGPERVRLHGEAADAYRQTLSVALQEAIPEEWASTQLSLARTLYAQAGSSEGEDLIRLLEETTSAIKAALAVWAEINSQEDSAPYQEWADGIDAEIASLRKGE
jgi:tetratricopeptide (TPR) repeat protein